MSHIPGNHCREWGEMNKLNFLTFGNKVVGYRNLEEEKILLNLVVSGSQGKLHARDMR